MMSSQGCNQLRDKLVQVWGQEMYVLFCVCVCVFVRARTHVCMCKSQNNRD